MSVSIDKTNKPRARRTSATTESDNTDKTGSDLIQTKYEEGQCDSTHEDKGPSGAVAVQSSHVDPSHPGYIAYINRIFKKS